MTDISASEQKDALAGGSNPSAVFGRIGKLPTIGRLSQLRSLEAAVDDAFNGRGQVILISGEAGAGKSRLVRECRRMALQSGGLVQHAECLIEPGAPPYDA